jgi:4-hydroxy-tetrahydrodipicolinate reductase
MQIALVGYGKMGKMIEEIALERGHEIVLKISRTNTEAFTQQNMAGADVAIEFTAPESAYNNVTQCIDFGVPVVSGSTGWNEHLQQAKQYCQQKGRHFFTRQQF